jgi:hypothetical protein
VLGARQLAQVRSGFPIMGRCECFITQMGVLASRQTLHSIREGEKAWQMAIALGEWYRQTSYAETLV